MRTIPSIQSINKLGFISGGFSAKLSSITPLLQPDPGYVFVYDENDNQVFDHLDRAVQVEEEYANS
jgi:hypothetical protein